MFNSAYVAGIFTLIWLSWWSILHGGTRGPTMAGSATTAWCSRSHPSKCYRRLYMMEIWQQFHPYFVSLVYDKFCSYPQSEKINSNTLQHFQQNASYIQVTLEDSGKPLANSLEYSIADEECGVGYSLTFVLDFFAPFGNEISLILLLWAMKYPL